MSTNKPRRRALRVAQNSLLLMLSMLTTAVLLEICARVYLVRLASDESFLEYASLHQLKKRRSSKKPKYSRHPYLGFYPTPGYIQGKNQHNSLGYRGEEIASPKPQGEFRIACLGGSTTYTEHVEDYRASYPDALEQELRGAGHHNVKVINAGAAGWSSWESLICFQFRILDLDPDLIIVYHGINDVHPRMVWPSRAYQGDNTGRRLSRPLDLFMPSALEHSTLARMLMIRAGKTTPHSAFETSIDMPPNTYYANQFRRQKARGTYPRGIFEEVSAGRMLEENPPQYFERNIRNITTLAKSNGIKIVLSSFAYSPLFDDKPRVSSEEYISAYAEMRDLLKTIAREMGVSFFDFSALFPVDKRYYTDGRHVTEEGAKLKAVLFGRHLTANGLLAVPVQ